jgi:hypothetical protein
MNVQATDSGGSMRGDIARTHDRHHMESFKRIRHRAAGKKQARVFAGLFEFMCAY